MPHLYYLNCLLYFWLVMSCQNMPLQLYLMIFQKLTAIKLQLKVDSHISIKNCCIFILIDNFSQIFWDTLITTFTLIFCSSFYKSYTISNPLYYIKLFNYWYQLYIDRNDQCISYAIQLAQIGFILLTANT